MTEENSVITESNIKQGYVDVLSFETPEAEAAFKTSVESLLENPVELNLIFPKVFEYKYLLGDKPEFHSGLTALPEELLDSDTYTQNMELRGPMEEIILETNRQRHLNRYPQLEVTGNGWSEQFRERMENILKLEQLPEPNIPKISTVVVNEPPTKTAESTVSTNVRNTVDLGTHQGTHIHRPGYNRGGFRRVNGKIMPRKPKI